MPELVIGAIALGPIIMALVQVLKHYDCQQTRRRSRTWRCRRWPAWPCSWYRRTRNTRRALCSSCRCSCCS